MVGKRAYAGKRDLTKPIGKRKGSAKAYQGRLSSKAAAQRARLKRKLSLRR